MTALVRVAPKLPPAPVLSRLALAWAAFFGGAVCALAAAALLSRPAPVATAAVDLADSGGVRLFAPGTAGAPAPAAPARRDEPPSIETGDMLESMAPPSGAASADLASPAPAPRAASLEALDDEAPSTGGPIIITIDGAPARDFEEARRKQAKPEPIAVAPLDPALSRETAWGRAPAIAPDGRRPMDVYARPFAAAEGAAPLALLVGGLGLDPALTERAIADLPPETTLAFAPYAKNLERWTEKARAAGHEIMIELPMEHGAAAANATLGDAALRTGRPPQENLRRLEWLLSRFDGYIGATNYLGSKFAADGDALTPILLRLKAAGLAYIDDTGAVQRLRETRAGGVGVADRFFAPAAGADKDRIAADLSGYEALAAERGGLIVKTYADAATLDALAEWARGLDGDGAIRAPVSAVLRARAPEAAAGGSAGRVVSHEAGG